MMLNFYIMYFQFLRTTDQSGAYLLCSACGRINAPDARFCDWCGIKVSEISLIVQPPLLHGWIFMKPSGPKQPVVCANCSATNSWESRHCVSCSAHIRPPSRYQQFKFLVIQPFNCSYRHGLDITSSMKVRSFTA